MGQKFRQFIDNFGYTRIVIILFLFVLLVSAFALELQIKSLLSGILIRTGMNLLLTLAMVPSINREPG